MFTKPEDFTKSGLNFALFYANTTFEGIERLAARFMRQRLRGA